jgi:hypothetical protein
MSTSTELVDDLLAALDGVPGLRPATLVTTGRAPWGWNLDATAVDISHGGHGVGGHGVGGHGVGAAGIGHTVVVRVVATQLPLPPLVRRAEQALLAVLAASDLPVTRLRLEITDLDGAAFA